MSFSVVPIFYNTNHIVEIIISNIETAHIQT